MSSRFALSKTAVRPSLKARMMLAGPAGAGKTRSALEIASALGESVYFIDTEKESALTYADDFQFTHLAWQPPFDPLELGKLLLEASAVHDVIVVDSLSHFWTGQGGTLDIAEGKFSGWKVARPAQQDLVEAILGVASHVIVCVRSKMEHVQEKDERTGKQVVKKLGMAPQQDATLEYELNLSCEIDIEHRIAVSKSRTTEVPVGRVFAPGHARDLAKVYGDWLASGEQFAALDVRAGIDTAIRQLTPDASRELQRLWRERALPKVALLTESQAATATELIRDLAAVDVPA